MLKSQKGFGFVGLVAILFVAVAVSLTGYTVYSRMQDGNHANTDDNENIQPAEPENLYKGEINAWLSGATDDNFINYYKLDYKLPELLVGCAADITAEAEELTEYAGRKLTVQITAKIEKVEQPDGPTCQALPSPYRGNVDLDKEWLSQDGELVLVVNGRGFTLTVDKKKYMFFLDSSSIMPFYPDKVGVLGVVPCAGYTRDELLSFAQDNGLVLADDKYPGLDRLYRKPEDIHVVFDDAAQVIYEQPFDRCSPHILKPVLIKRLNS